jgi:hypothetical protein
MEVSNMKSILSTLLLVLLLAAIFPQNSMFARASADSSYFPLYLGSQWAFASEMFAHTENIARTATIHGKLYYGFTFGSDDVAYWYRACNDSIYVVNDVTYNDSTESLLYDFNSNVGDTIRLPSIYACSFGIELALVSKQDTVTTPAGTFTNCFHFRHNPACVDAGTLESWFARGVGCVRYIQDNFAGYQTFDLTSYNIATSVHSQQLQICARSFRLYDAYPNPFNPQITFRYQIETPNVVSLSVVDLLGRQVGQLADGKHESGEYQTSWNASALPSGVYFVVLRSGNSFQTKKIVLQK